MNRPRLRRVVQPKQPGEEPPVETEDTAAREAIIRGRGDVVGSFVLELFRQQQIAKQDGPSVEIDE